VPVQRFRTFEDARRALWLPSGSPDILDRMRKLGELARTPARPHGVLRFRTIAEAKTPKGSAYAGDQP
jgi:hypothetical protein